MLSYASAEADGAVVRHQLAHQLQHDQAADVDQLWRRACRGRGEVLLERGHVYVDDIAWPAVERSEPRRKCPKRGWGAVLDLVHALLQGIAQDSGVGIGEVGELARQRR